MSVTALHVLYKREFEPVVRPLENVAIVDSLDESKWIFGKVLFIEPLQEQTINLGELGAADKDNYPTPGSTKELTELKVGENEFAQYRIYVLDDFLLEVKQPSAVSRFVNKEGATKIPKFIARDNFAEIFVYEDEVPTVQPYAILFTSLPMARIKVMGFRYVLQPLREKPREFTVIPVGGISPRARSRR